MDSTASLPADPVPGTPYSARGAAPDLIATPHADTPDYLQSVEGLEPRFALLAFEGETRKLTWHERRSLDRAVRRAGLRVLAAKARRDGYDALAASLERREREMRVYE
jgi:hypothetical protein